MSAESASPAPTAAFTAAMTGEATTRRQATPAGAFIAARDLLRRGARIDMAALAADVGVSRTTLYRWTGDRDRLLGDVVWAELSGMIDHFDRAAPGRGAERMTAAAAGFLDTLAASDALHAFLANEGDAGLRLVTDLRGGVRPRLRDKITQIIEREAALGYRPPDSPTLLADGILSLAERWLYHNGDPALNPEPATARRVIALLLRE